MLVVEGIGHEAWGIRTWTLVRSEKDRKKKK
jgi:hypothetical protein